jgi:hypothetical protein
MYIQALALYGNICAYASYYWLVAKQYARTWLGPEQQQYYLLSDGQVLPSSTHVPATVQQTTYRYDPLTNRITAFQNREPEGRFRPLRYLSMRIDNTIVGNIDISDWLGEIRANPVPTLSPKQILNLWSYTHNQYVPQDGATTVIATTNMGEEETVTV